MNFKRISHRISLCELKRLQSSLSASNSKIQIPARIKREPTDILKALDSTIPKDSARINCIYRDDPFLTPLSRNNYRTYGLSYESGKKTAMWIHKEHRNLFPKNLSEPIIDAFQPPAVYNDKDQVSEEILLQVISQYSISDALDIYRLLEANVSNQAKQALLELLCFYNDEKSTVDELIFERWFSTTMKNKYVLRYRLEINELYQFLIKQDPPTAAAAHNAMICGLAKYFRVDEAWSMYQDCKQKNIPLNVTTYNYILALIPDMFDRNDMKQVQPIFDILKEMNEKKIKPNVRTLNAALKTVTKSRVNEAKNIIKFLFSEFERMNIKFSLATYYYPMLLYSPKDRSAHKDFITTLYMLQNHSFTIQDPEDNLFFSQAMFLAYHFSDRRAGELIHDLLFTGNNRVFISNVATENNYYSSYMSLLLTTSTIEEFFDYYEKIVPSLYMPQKSVFNKIVTDLQYNKAADIAKYLPKLWSDLNMGPKDLSLMLACINLMNIDDLPPDSDLRTTFVDAAWFCWQSIKNEIKTRPEAYNPIETVTLAHIALMLLCDKRIKEAIEVLMNIINQPDLFIPTITEQQINKLFNTFVSEQCIAEAFLVIEYAANLGFQNITEMSTELYNHPQLTSVDRNKLLDLIGVETLNTLNRSKSS